MADKKTSDKLITIILIIVISIAAIAFIYISIPKESKNETSDGENNNQQVEQEIVLTLIYGDEQLEYSLEDLEDLEDYTCTSSMIKTGWLPTVKIEGPNEFTGIRISTLLNEIDNLPRTYYINVISLDGENTSYDIDQIQGNVDIYNDSGVIIDNTGAIMILAYKIDGEYFTEEDTLPLRIVFCSDNLTSSSLWAKMVNTIEIIEQ